VVLTVTTGSSMRGYSRTVSRWNDTRPISTISSDITVASTGRRIEVSDSQHVCQLLWRLAGQGRAEALAQRHGVQHRHAWPAPG
jgi:hypothetical protein